MPIPHTVDNWVGRSGQSAAGAPADGVLYIRGVTVRVVVTCGGQ